MYYIYIKKCFPALSARSHPNHAPFTLALPSSPRPHPSSQVPPLPQPGQPSHTHYPFPLAYLSHTLFPSPTPIPSHTLPFPLV